MLHGIGFRKHVVEFVSGVGVITDEVTDATSVNGPWTWVAPVAELLVEGTAAGGGGGGGATLASARAAGGGGAGSGCACWGVPLLAIPGGTLTVTLGAAGTGGAAGVAGTGRNATTIDGLSTTSPFTLFTSTTSGQFRLSGGAPGSFGTSTTGGGGGRAGDDFTNAIANSFTGSANAASPTAGSNNGTHVLHASYGCHFSGQGGAGGGGASTTGTTAGAIGGQASVTTGGMFDFVAGGSGNTDGTNSYGGGGAGGCTTYGRGGLGGAGNAVGGNATGFGGGGGGAGGTKTGGNGGPAYIKITYWSAE